MDTIKLFYWQLEPSPVKVIDPIMCKHKKQKPPHQYSHIDYETPQQHVTYYINRHVTPPECYGIWQVGLSFWLKQNQQITANHAHVLPEIVFSDFVILQHITTNLKSSVNNDKSQIHIQGIIFSQKCKYYSKWYEIKR